VLSIATGTGLLRVERGPNPRASPMSSVVVLLKTICGKIDERASLPRKKKFHGFGSRKFIVSAPIFQSFFDL